MKPDETRKLRDVIRQFRAGEKERIDQYFDLAEQLLAIIADQPTCAAAIAVSGGAGPGGRERRLVNKSELAKRLGVSTRTVSDLLSDGMPCVRLGRRVQFDYEDVLTWAKGRQAKDQRTNRLRVVR